ncbi:MAG: LysR family transcriptional regulator [Bacteriovoracaceae bacterium]|nr:LysR family transcriptional regulator [Bacteriovoracaceae bacterium]
MIETSQLHTLIAVAQAKSFSKAADVLGVTQSAISQSVKNLESKLDVKIFKRSGKSVVLTAEGEKLYTLAFNFIEKMEQTLEELRGDKNEMQGKVRIGTLTGIGKTWLAKEVVWHAKENPDLQLSVRMGHQEDLLLDFEANKLDILILPEDDLPLQGEREFFLEEKSTLVFPHSMKDEFFLKKLTLESLETIPTVLFEQNDHLFMKWCRSKFKSLPKKLNVRFSVNSHGHMLQAVSEGLGIAVVPNHVLNRSYFKDKVLTLGDEFEVPSGKLFIVYHKESENLVRIKNTIDRLLSHRDTFKI